MDTKLNPNLLRRFEVFATRKAKGGVLEIRAGVANAERDGTIVITLDVLPIDGQLVLRPPAAIQPSTKPPVVVRVTPPPAPPLRCPAVHPVNGSATGLPWRCDLDPGHDGDHVFHRAGANNNVTWSTEPVRPEGYVPPAAPTTCTKLKGCWLGAGHAGDCDDQLPF